MEQHCKRHNKTFPGGICPGCEKEFAPKERISDQDLADHIKNEDNSPQSWTDKVALDLRDARLALSTLEQVNKGLREAMEGAWKSAAISCMALDLIVSGKQTPNPEAFTYAQQLKNWKSITAICRAGLDNIALSTPEASK